MILDLLGAGTKPCIQNSLASAPSRSTRTASCWRRRTCSACRLAMWRARRLGPRRQPRARPRHLHHHRRADRRQAPAAGRRLRSVPHVARGTAVAGAIGRRLLRRPDPRRRRRVLVHRQASHAVLDDLRRVRAGHRARPRHRPARLPGGRLLLRPADRRAVGHHLHQSAGCRQRRHAARRAPAPDADLRGGRRAAHPDRAAGDRTARASRSPAGRSGPTCFSTPSRASSSRSTAAIRAAMVSRASRPRSSSRSSLRRSAW